MLFRAIETYLSTRAPARVMPHLKAYVETLNVSRGLISARYLNAPGDESPLVVLLRKILADADIPSLMRKPTDFACYSEILTYTVSQLNAIFNTVTTGLHFSRIAIRQSSGHTEEFFIPVSCQDPFTDLPFDQGWDAWRNVRPLRMVDNDSQELTFATYQDQIVFSKQPPKRVVFTIDVVALVLQHVAFLRESEQAISEADYFHRYVLVSLLQDLQDLWLANIYAALLENPTRFTSNTRLFINQVTGDTCYGYPGSELTLALRELSGTIDTCQRGLVSPTTLVQSLVLSGGSLTTYLQRLVDTTTVNDQRQYYWVEYLRDIRWLTILYYAYQLQPTSAPAHNLRVNLSRDIPILVGTRFWNSARSETVREAIEQDVRDRLVGMY